MQLKKYPNSLINKKKENFWLVLSILLCLLICFLRWDQEFYMGLLGENLRGQECDIN